MKVGIFSDTHDRLPTLRRAIALFTRLEVDAIFHAGDFVAPFAAKLLAPTTLSIPLHCVFGNNDGERAGLRTLLPQVVDGCLATKLGGQKIVMRHFIDDFEPAEIKQADIIISGHTHQVFNETKAGKLFLNPGECCGWVADRCTIALLDLETKSAEIIEVHE